MAGQWASLRNLLYRITVVKWLRVLLTERGSHDQSSSGVKSSSSGCAGLSTSAAAAAAVKKRRKSRTAFTNKQIYELEKRFLYQKYLTPADRDEIAQALALSNAQVINHRCKQEVKLSLR